jgi:serpin B
MKIRLTLLSFLVAHLAAPAGVSGQGDPGPGTPAAAAKAVNSLGLEVLSKGTDPKANTLLSPYSIQSALAMTFAGAAGDTRAEMARVLHFTGDETELHHSFASLQKALEDVAKSTAEQAKLPGHPGGGGEPVTLTVANRLFGQSGYDFRAPFLGLVKNTYGAPFQPMDFIRNFRAATREINGWVERQTRQRIRDLIPADGLNADTRLVLVNAIYLKAPWMDPFPEYATKPAPFHVPHGKNADVPTMVHQGYLGYAKRDGYRVVTVPYRGGDLQLLILLPDKVDGLATLEAKLTPDQLAANATPETSEVILHLPKFKMEPPVFRLGEVLQRLGMKSAFDHPRGSANFDRMAPRKPTDYLLISEVFHKTFLALDEKGTEAAAATAVAMARASAFMGKPKPVEVRVDHPFLFAIQHRPSGACLFLGRITQLP